MAWYNLFNTKAAPALGDSGTISTSSQLYAEMMGQTTDAPAVLSPYSPKTNISLAYRDNVIGHLCADLIATSSGRIDLFVKMGETELDDRSHPLVKRINRPNPKTSKARFIQQIVYDLVLTGNAYILRNEVGRKSGKGEWWILPSRSVTIRTDTKGRFPDGYQFNMANGDQIVYKCDPETGFSDVLHLTNFNPLDDYVGLPSAVAALRQLEIFTASEEYNFNTLKKGGLPKLIAFFKDFGNGQTRGMTKEQKLQVAENLKNFSGPNRKSDVLITQGDLDFKELKTTPKEMEFIEMQQEAARSIARAFGVPAVLLGIPGDNTYSNQEQALVFLYTSRIIPMIDYITEELTVWMAPIWGEDVCIEYDLDSVDQLAAHNRERWESFKDVSWLTDDEKREMAGFGPLPKAQDPLSGQAAISEVVEREDTPVTIPEVVTRKMPK